MNLNMFDNIDGLVLRERENSLRRPPQNSGQIADMPEFPTSAPLAMAYVPFQSWGDTMSAENALNCGTLFSDLVFPFEEGGTK